ncbi:ATP-binding cassette domain-containing protein [Pseudomonas tolaasii]|uniref:ATP-binding cassette domain-containing protein n=1 Tax=Pseudomonas tolaasii TaxID=29442 RepID=UPI000316BED4|nr:ATP-binding cassette domain-containing protein [Pseudomonas tolaasii]
MSHTTEPLLRASHLSKTFGAVQALDQVDLTIYPGEGVALLGASGAGKSTLVKVLGGQLAAQAGELWVDGQRQRFTSPLSARRVGIVAVHQRPDEGIAPGLSVAENLLLDELCLPGADFLLNRKNLLLRAEAIAAVLGLDLPLQHPVERLSQSDRQLLVLARAFALQPRLLILDEPTTALSDADAERLQGLIERERSRRGMAVLCISQRVADLQRVTSRAVVLHEGRMGFNRQRAKAQAVSAAWG